MLEDFELDDIQMLYCVQNKLLTLKIKARIPKNCGSSFYTILFWCNSLVHLVILFFKSCPFYTISVLERLDCLLSLIRWNLSKTGMIYNGEHSIRDGRL